MNRANECGMLTWFTHGQVCIIGRVESQTGDESYIQLHEMLYQGMHIITVADNNFPFINYHRCSGIKDDEGTQNVLFFGQGFLEHSEVWVKELLNCNLIHDENNTDSPDI